MNTHTETKHTPGPWFHRSSEGGWDCVKDSSGQVICNLVLNVPENAALIAAAPELLEALRAVLPLLDIAFSYEGDVFGSSYNAAGDADDQARAAIAKATGGAQ